MARRADARPKLTRAPLEARDGAWCPHCGTSEALTVQHRRTRGMGGSRDGERPSNGILLCWGYNVACEQYAEVAEEARANGWKLRAYDDPSQVAYYDRVTQSWWLLHDDWTREPAPSNTIPLQEHR